MHDDEPMTSMPVEFRCISCGSIGLLSAPAGTLTLGIKSRPIDANAPQCSCGATSWVLLGSTTEFYYYSSRDDVCRIGDHVDARARPFKLYPREVSTARVRIESLDVCVCPDHEEELHANGILGWFPRKQEAGG